MVGSCGDGYDEEEGEKKSGGRQGESLEHVPGEIPVGLEHELVSRESRLEQCIDGIMPHSGTGTRGVGKGVTQ